MPMEFTAMVVFLFSAKVQSLIHNLKQKRNIFNLFLSSLDSSLSTHTLYIYRRRMANADKNLTFLRNMTRDWSVGKKGDAWQVGYRGVHVEGIGPEISELEY